MGDRIVVMKDGVVQQIGKPDAVYRRPHTIFVARFIGSPAMNTADGTLASRDGHLFLDTSIGTIELPPAIRAEILGAASDASARVTWGIRPEDVTVSTDGSPTAKSLRGVVDLVEHLGADAYASVKAGEDVIVARVSPDTLLTNDQCVTLSVNGEKLHLFDINTGDSLFR